MGGIEGIRSKLCLRRVRESRATTRIRFKILAHGAPFARTTWRLRECLPRLLYRAIAFPISNAKFPVPILRNTRSLVLFSGESRSQGRWRRVFRAKRPVIFPDNREFPLRQVRLRLRPPPRIPTPEKISRPSGNYRPISRFVWRELRLWWRLRELLSP
jgi:hypothetical protein